MRLEQESASGAGGSGNPLASGLSGGGGGR